MVPCEKIAAERACIAWRRPRDQPARAPHDAYRKLVKDIRPDLPENDAEAVKLNKERDQLVHLFEVRGDAPMICPICGQSTGCDRKEICDSHLSSGAGGEGNRVIGNFLHRKKKLRWSKRNPKPDPEVVLQLEACPETFEPVEEIAF